MKNRDRRKSSSIDAEIFICGRMFSGKIYNISREGAYIEVPVLHTEAECTVDSIVEVKFQATEEEWVDVSCRVVRIDKKKTAQGPASCIGLKIDHIPTQYKDYFESL